MASRIFVTGSIRSGTTFVGKALSTSPDSIYIHEPFNPDSPWNSTIPAPVKYFYINDHNKRIYDFRMSRLLDLSPVISGKWQDQVRLDREQYIKSALLGSSDQERINVILKDPIGIFCTEWLVNSWHLKPVIVVRDPRDVIRSIYRLSWQQGLFNNWIKIQPELHARLLGMEECLGINGYVSIERSNSDLRNVIAFLKPIYLALLYFTKVSGYQMVCYERLTVNPVIEFNKLFQSVGLVMSKEFELSLRNKDNTFDRTQTHQNTSNPVSAVRIRELHQTEETNTSGDESIIMDSFGEIKNGFGGSVDWWGE